MGLRDLMSKKITSKKIDSPTNDDYKRICLEKGNHEIREIMLCYTEAMKEAGKIFVKGGALGFGATFRSATEV
jgi:hypothetical protein